MKDVPAVSVTVIASRRLDLLPLATGNTENFTTFVFSLSSVALRKNGRGTGSRLHRELARFRTSGEDSAFLFFSFSFSFCAFVARMSTNSNFRRKRSKRFADSGGCKSIYRIEIKVKGRGTQNSAVSSNVSSATLNLGVTTSNLRSSSTSGPPSIALLNFSLQRHLW